MTGSETASAGPSGRRAEILAVGRELLIGRTADSNSSWLARRLTEQGWEVGRITAVDDEHADIVAALREVAGRGARLVVTTGGLGPTADDRTLPAVAEAAGVALREHPEALGWIEAFYDRLAGAGHIDRAGLTPQRRKMALLPAGAEAVPNPVGAAPGVILDRGASGGPLVVCLPGVPAEMKGIFEETLEARLRAEAAGSGFDQRLVETPFDDESELSPILDQVRAEFPGIWVKSLAGAFERRGIPVVLSAHGPEAARLLDRAERRLRGILDRGR